MRGVAALMYQVEAMLLQATLATEVSLRSPHPPLGGLSYHA
jgi:hypothetical protein